MNEIMERIQSFDLNAAVSQLEETGHVLAQEEMTVLAVLAAVGILWCFLGLKIVRVWAALLGFAIGFAGGTYAGQFLNFDEAYFWIPGVVLGAILAGLGAFLYHFGVFVTVWLATSAACVYLIRPADWIYGAICIAVGFVIALLSIRFAEVITMFVTAVFGAALSGSSIYYLIPVKGFIIHIVLCVLLGIVGLIIQLALESKKRKKRSLKKAAEIKAANSTANEVEKARAFADVLDETESRDAKEEKAVPDGEEFWSADDFADEEEAGDDPEELSEDNAEEDEKNVEDAAQDEENEKN